MNFTCNNTQTLKTANSMKRIIVFRLLAIALPLAVASAIWTSCRDDLEGQTFLTSEDVMVDDYIMQNDLSMSKFLDIVDRAEFRGMLHAYGVYTCFVPVNEAIDEYLSQRGKASVADLAPEECADIVKYHVVRHSGEGDDMVAFMSSDFIDGRLGNPTMLVKYLTTKTVQLSGKTVTQVNREANILEKDIYVANGYIHKIDKVLIPPEKTCGEQLEELPDAEYSLFKQIMRQTSWIDSLNVLEEGLWYSIFLQSNEAFASVGISSIEQLLEYLKDNAKYSDKTDDELLDIYAAYHCVKGLYYIADLSKVSALQSMAANQAITIKLKRDTLLVNEYGSPSSGNYEQGVAINKSSEYTDYSCSNGVLTDMYGYIGPKVRGAQAVFWDVAEQPEIVSNSRFRKASIPVPWEELQNWSEMKFSLASGIKTYGEFAYDFRSSYVKEYQFINQDALTLRWYRLASLEFTLPLLTPGTYNVWVGFRRAETTNCRVRATLVQEGEDDQAMGMVKFEEYINTDAAAEVLLPEGYKRYAAKERASTMNCVRWGTCVVQSTGRHKLRCDVVERGRNADMWLDMIMFIPIEDDQLWPRFDMKGKAVYPGTPCEEIWPYANACSDNNDVR
jgi:uncharacterized surface protein with fasciclin (FAS1) repeats